MMKKIFAFLQKFSPPIFNALIMLGVGIILAPFQPLPPKLFIIIVFFAYLLICFLFNNNRDLGMAMLGVEWRKNYPRPQQFIEVLLYSLSFASIFYYVFFPFDLLLVNIVLLQVPSILFAGMPFHAFAAGRMEIIVPEKNAITKS